MVNELKAAKRDRARHTSTANSYGCLRSLARISAFLLLIIVFPVIFLHRLFSPLEQQLVDYLHQIINFSIPADKESDMIAITCGRDVYTIYPNGDNLKRIRQGSLHNRFQHISWSPDGEWLALALTEFLSWHNDSIYKLRFDGSLSKRLTFDKANKRLVEWTEDGSALRYISGEDVWQVPADGGKPTRLDLDGFELYRSSDAAWSPSGDALIVERGKHYAPTESVGYLYMLAPGEGGLVWEHALVESLNWLDVYGAGVDRIRWSPTGDRIAYRAHQKGYLYKGDAPADGFRMRSEIRILDLETKVETKVYEPFRYDELQWSPNGQWIALTDYGGIVDDSERHLLVLDANTGDIRDLAKGELHRAVTWSPDSEWIAFAFETGDDGGLRWDKSHVFKIRRDGSDLKHIVELDCDLHAMSWSPQ